MVEREFQFLKERENLLTGIRLLDQLRVKHVSNKHQIGANQQNTIDLQLGILTRIIVQLLGSKFTTLHFPRIGHTHEHSQLNYSTKIIDLANCKWAKVQKVIEIPKNLICAKEVRIICISWKMCYSHVV